jgi:hypothetical protein
VVSASLVQRSKNLRLGPKFLHTAFSQKPNRKGSKTLKKKITLKDKRWGFSKGFHHNLFFFFKKEKLYLYVKHKISSLSQAIIGDGMK